MNYEDNTDLNLFPFELHLNSRPKSSRKPWQSKPEPSRSLRFHLRPIHSLRYVGWLKKHCWKGLIYCPKTYVTVSISRYIVPSCNARGYFPYCIMLIWEIPLSSWHHDSVHFNKRKTCINTTLWNSMTSLYGSCFFAPPQYKISINFKVAWTFNDAKIPSDIEEQTITNMTCLRIRSAKREFTGNYKFTLSNDFGSCEHTIKLIVLGEISGFDWNFLYIYTLFQLIICFKIAFST